jgi:SMI1/KNR4 family protein SUKH-1
MVTANGLPLPASLVLLLRDGVLWLKLKANVDAYGDPFEGDWRPLSDDEITRDSTHLQEYWGGMTQEDIQRSTEEEQDSPGFLTYITNFSKIVRFGETITGEPYCLDYRESPQEPRVIHWDDGDCYWRQVAPNFDSFIRLFKRE